MTKILLVEDDPMISEIYQRKFLAAGFDSRIAASGKSVLDMLRIESVDLVLLDIVLPEMSGMEVLEQLRDPKNGFDPNLKILMFSNLNERDDHDKALALGADGFIPKTEFSPSKLIEEVSRLLRQFESRKKNGQERTVPTEAPSVATETTPDGASTEGTSDSVTAERDTNENEKSGL